MEFLKRKKYFLRHRSSRQQYERVSVVEYNGQAAVLDELSFRTDDGELILLKEYDIISSQEVPDNSETYINQRALSASPVLPPPLPVVVKQIQPDEADHTIHDAELLEDTQSWEPVPVATVPPNNPEVAVLTRAARDMLNGVAALKDSPLYEERQRAIKFVIGRFYEFVGSDHCPDIKPDDVTVGIERLFSYGMEEAAIQMEYARWSIPDHRPRNASVHTPWLPALER